MLTTHYTYQKAGSAQQPPWAEQAQVHSLLQAANVEAQPQVFLPALAENGLDAQQI